MRPFLFIPILCLLLHCAVRQWPVYERDGERFGVTEGSFRGKWWNYYERGLSYLSGGFFKEALDDFLEAVKRNPLDMRNAQTYGTNFIDYFPHRESGIVYYKTGNLKEAEEELELSISQSPTAKASCYLDCVRKELIDKSSGEIPPPVITLCFKEEEVFTRDDPVVISGDAADENYIADLRVNGKPVLLQGSRKHVHFEQSLDLPQGRHVVGIEARNLAGKGSKAGIILVVDREGPVINIDELTITKADNGKGVFIKGLIEDPAKVSRVYINGERIAIEENRQVEINSTLTISFPIVPMAKISIVAVDSLGNPSTLHIPLSSSSGSHVPVRLASADPGMGLGISLPDGGPSVKVGFNDNIPDNLKVYQDKLYIKGQAVSGCTITRIFINGEPERYKCSRIIAFSKLVPLGKGENIIIVEAIDEEGNKGEARRVIRAEEPQAFEWTERMILSIPRFKHFKNNRLLTGNEDSTIDDFQTFLRKALFEQGRFFIRDEDDAQYYIDGKIRETGKSIEILGEIKDAEHDELLASVDVFKEAKNIEELGYDMAYRILLEFPMIKGEVKLCTDSHIFTDVYHEKLKLRTNLIVYREELLIGKDMEGIGKDTEGIEAVTQEVITDHKVLGRARLKAKLDEKMRTKAVLIQCKPGEVRVSDKVITE